MTIEKVESWGFAGKLYLTEEKAVDAAIREIAARLMKDHAGSLAVGLIDKADQLIPLLQRHGELAAAKPDVAPASDLADHPPTCHYRATGIRTDCNCAGGMADRIARAAGSSVHTGHPSDRAFNAPERGSQEYARHVSPHSSDGIGG